VCEAVADAGGTAGNQYTFRFHAGVAGSEACTEWKVTVGCLAPRFNNISGAMPDIDPGLLVTQEAILDEE
jgi:hypothetical protein